MIYFSTYKDVVEQMAHEKNTFNSVWQLERIESHGFIVLLKLHDCFRVFHWTVLPV